MSQKIIYISEPGVRKILAYIQEQTKKTQILFRTDYAMSELQEITFNFLKENDDKAICKVDFKNYNTGRKYNKEYTIEHSKLKNIIRCKLLDDLQLNTEYYIHYNVRIMKSQMQDSEFLNSNLNDEEYLIQLISIMNDKSYSNPQYGSYIYPTSLIPPTVISPNTSLATSSTTSSTTTPTTTSSSSSNSFDPYNFSINSSYTPNSSTTSSTTTSSSTLYSPTSSNSSNLNNPLINSSPTQNSSTTSSITVNEINNVITETGTCTPIPYLTQQQQQQKQRKDTFKTVLPPSDVFQQTQYQKTRRQKQQQKQKIKAEQERLAKQQQLKRIAALLAKQQQQKRVAEQQQKRVASLKIGDFMKRNMERKKKAEQQQKQKRKADQLAARIAAQLAKQQQQKDEVNISQQQIKNKQTKCTVTLYENPQTRRINDLIKNLSSKKSVQNSESILNEIYKLKPNETDVEKINTILQSDTRGRFNLFGSDKIGNKFTNYSDFEKKKINQEKNEKYKKTNEYKRKENIKNLVVGLKNIPSERVGEYLETFQKLKDMNLDKDNEFDKNMINQINKFLKKKNKFFESGGYTNYKSIASLIPSYEDYKKIKPEQIQNFSNLPLIMGDATLGTYDYEAPEQTYVNNQKKRKVIDKKISQRNKRQSDERPFRQYSKILTSKIDTEQSVSKEKIKNEVEKLEKLAPDKVGEHLEILTNLKKMKLGKYEDDEIFIDRINKKLKDETGYFSKGGGKNFKSFGVLAKNWDEFKNLDVEKIEKFNKTKLPVNRLDEKGNVKYYNDSQKQQRENNDAKINNFVRNMSAKKLRERDLSARRDRDINQIKRIKNNSDKFQNLLSSRKQFVNLYEGKMLSLDELMKERTDFDEKNPENRITDNIFYKIVSNSIKLNLKELESLDPQNIEKIFELTNTIDGYNVYLSDTDKREKDEIINQKINTLINNLNNLDAREIKEATNLLKIISWYEEHYVPTENKSNLKNKINEILGSKNKTSVANIVTNAIGGKNLRSKGIGNVIPKYNDFKEMNQNTLMNLESEAQGSIRKRVKNIGSGIRNYFTGKSNQGNQKKNSKNNQIKQQQSNSNSSSRTNSNSKRSNSNNSNSNSNNSNSSSRTNSNSSNSNNNNSNSSSNNKKNNSNNNNNNKTTATKQQNNIVGNITGNVSNNSNIVSFDNVRTTTNQTIQQLNRRQRESLEKNDKQLVKSQRNSLLNSLQNSKKN